MREHSKSDSSTPMAVSKGNMAFNKTGSWRYLRPIYQEKLAPCRSSCPAGTDVPRVLNLIGEGKFEVDTLAVLMINQPAMVPEVALTG